MSAQFVSNQTDPRLVSSFAPELLPLENGNSPDFFSLSLLEDANYCQGAEMSSLQFLSGQTDAVQSRAPSEQNKCQGTYQLAHRDRVLSPTPNDCSESSGGAEINHILPSLWSDPAVPSFSSLSSFSSTSSGIADHDPAFGFRNIRGSPHPYVGSSKSTSPPCWQNRDMSKRARHLERNRAAANKSRKKKKQEIDQLQKRFQEVSHRRSALEEEVKQFRSQLLSLKDQVLMHSRCDDKAINLYVSRMVKQATQHNCNVTVPAGTPEDEDVL